MDQLLILMVLSYWVGSMVNWNGCPSEYCFQDLIWTGVYYASFGAYSFWAWLKWAVVDQFWIVRVVSLVSIACKFWDGRVYCASFGGRIHFKSGGWNEPFLESSVERCRVWLEKLNNSTKRFLFLECTGIFLESFENCFASDYWLFVMAFESSFRSPYRVLDLSDDFYYISWK